MNRVILFLWTVFLCMCLGIYVTLSHAQEKKVPCEYSLAEKTVQAKNLDDDRDAKERRISTLETQLYFERQAAKALQQQIEELKKAQEKKD